MALCYLPCFGEARILFRSGVSVPLSTGSNAKRSGFPCNTASTWSIHVKRYHSRRHRHGIPLPFQLNLKQATRTLQQPWIVIPIARVAQSSGPAVTPEERSSASLLAFSYAPPPIVSGEDGDADGGRAFSSSSSDVDSREQLRRDRIARANKGRVPWNKGRRHSPETIAKIKERTRTAMRNPQVREKLRQYGKSQTVETKVKIREKLVGFWEAKRIIRETQVQCVRDWNEVIAEAARVGAPGEEELEWDSYKKIKEQYKLEDLKAERQRKAELRASLKSERQRKPVSEAHRKAISDAIRAKWADPEYQRNVSVGLAKAEANLRRKSPPPPKEIAVDTSETKVAPSKSPKSTVAIVEEVPAEKKKPPQAVVPVDEDFIAEVLAEEVTLQTRSKRSTAARIKGPRKVTLVSLEDHNIMSSGDDSEAAGTKDQGVGQEEVPWAAVQGPLSEADVRAPSSTVGSEHDVQLSSKLSSQSYKDPLVLEKVQRIQQLRQGRVEVELKRKEAANRARMLIANAERAANALEQAGNADAATLATLREARRVLAEATRYVQASEVKPGTSVSLDKSTPPRSSPTKESEKKFGFHSRIWTEGDSLEDCPHPIPIRPVKLSSRGERQQQQPPQLDETVHPSSDSGSREAEPEDAVGSSDHHEETVHPGEELHMAAAATAAAAAEEGSRSSQSSTTGSGSKKRWHRGRLVVMDEDE